MLKNEHLDVRTVTLGINLLDCASQDVNKLKNNIQTRIMHFAENLVYQCDRIGQKFGIPVVNKRIAVSPIAVVGAAMSSSQMVDVVKTLDSAAQSVNVDFIGGFSALVEKGIARGDRALIEALPHALTATERVCASVNVASTRAGINMDAVLLMGDSCILGPVPRSHVVCRDLPHEVVLSRRDGGLYCRAEGTFQIDGCACQGQGPVNRNSQLVGETFSIKLEEL